MDSNADNWVTAEEHEATHKQMATLSESHEWDNIACEKAPLMQRVTDSLLTKLMILTAHRVDSLHNYLWKLYMSNTTRWG